MFNRLCNGTALVPVKSEMAPFVHASWTSSFVAIFYLAKKINSIVIQGTPVVRTVHKATKRVLNPRKNPNSYIFTE